MVCVQPAWPTPVRQAPKDMWLSNGSIFVPRATVLWCPMLCLHNSSAYWEEHDKFKPERWLEAGAEYFEPKEKGAPPVKKFIPFSNGQ